MTSSLLDAARQRLYDARRAYYVTLAPGQPFGADPMTLAQQLAWDTYIHAGHALVQLLTAHGIYTPPLTHKDAQQ